MTPVQVVGLVLWRGGVLLVLGYLGYIAVRAMLSIADAQLELAVSVALTGLLLVFASVITERISDVRAEQARSE